MNFIKEHYRLVFSSLFLLVLLVFSTTAFTDKENIKKDYDGLVVTDKSGKAYMLQHKFNDRFVVKEFDLEKMKLR